MNKFTFQLILCLFATALAINVEAQIGPRRNGRTTSATSSNAAGQTSSTPAKSSKSASTAGNRISDQQKKNLQQLEADLNSIKQGSAVTQAQINALKSSLTALAQGTTKPDSATVQKLANDLSAALADGNLTPAEKSKLAVDLQKVLNSANISSAEINQVISDAQTILAAADISPAEVQAVINDLNAIVNELKINLPAVKSSTAKPATKTTPRFSRRGNNFR